MFKYEVVSHRNVDILVLVVIVLNVSLMSSQHYGQSQGLMDLQDYGNMLFTIFFICEMGVKVINE